MDRQVTFIRKVIGTNDYNEDKVESWEALPVNPTVWARLIDREGKEAIIADRITSLMKTIATIDYREDLKYGMRFVYNSVPYEIVSIRPNNQSRERYLDVTAEMIDTEVWT